MAMYNTLNGSNYKFCGYTYTYEVMEEDDNRKYWHDIVDSSGARFSMDFSPYSFPSEEQFQDAVVEHMLREYFKNFTDNGDSNVLV
jgi:hypothetical protein